MSRKDQKNQEERNNRRESLNTYLKYSTVGFQMVVIIGGGAFLGDWLDQKYNEEGKLYTVVCSLLSIFFAMYLTLKELIKSSK